MEILEKNNQECVNIEVVNNDNEITEMYDAGGDFLCFLACGALCYISGMTATAFSVAAVAV